MQSALPGEKFRQALVQESPLQVVGVINAYAALQAQQSGFKAIYLSGAGVANASHGMPDLGITQPSDVVEDVRRITDVCDLPLLVDADTGWGTAFNIERSVKAIERAGAAGLHLEDQVQAKRCGHRPNKAIVSTAEMVDRVTIAAQSKRDDQFVIMARTDALANEGIDAAIERACSYVEAGADMIFPEALQTLEEYQKFSQALKVPILANITEFGRTPLFSADELADAGVRMVLYPLSAFRAMSQAAKKVYETIRKEGGQSSVIKVMQNRDELYETIGYHEYEKKLDKL